MPISRSEVFKLTTYLGAQISADDPFFAKTACMTVEWREVMAALEILKKRTTDKAKLKRIEMIELVVQRFGQAAWMPDIFSHLAMKAGVMEKVYDVDV